MLNIYNQVAKDLNENYLFENKPKICVAVSGGPDSIALTFILKKWISKNNGEIFAVIVDHQIRQNSKKESNFVKEYLNKNKIKSTILKVNKKDTFKKSMNQARKNRYLKLTNFCKKNNILHLFLAHHYNDNIETFILRKIAGSNIQGLISMKEKTLYKGIQIIRPLLKYNKKELIDYNFKENLLTINDPSNTNEIYSRVVIRKYLRDDKSFKENALKDFNFIRSNYENYITMVYELLNYCFIKIGLKQIELDYLMFLKQDIDIKIKFFEIIYKFYQPHKPYLRYVKIKNAISQIEKSNNGCVYLSKMKIKKYGNVVIFSR